MKKTSLLAAALLICNYAFAQYSLNDWKIDEKDYENGELYLNVKEYRLNFNHPLPYADFQKDWTVKADLKCGTLGTEQVFVCKEGKASRLIGRNSLSGDISLGYDSMQKKFFVEVTDKFETPHRLFAGPVVEAGKWYAVEASAQYDARAEESTLTLSVDEESSSLVYPGHALRHNASLWVIGRGFPGGFPNSLQVRDGYIRNLSISGSALPHVTGQNPLFPGRYTADPAFTVVGDTVYAYVGEDCAAPGGWFNMPHWLCYSSKDMKNWTFHGQVLAAGDFPYASPNGAWAGQVVEKDGKYFYYVTLDRKDNGEHTVDVAVSDSPTGPFVPARKDGTPLVSDGMTPDSYRPNADIDPTVLIDDDGTPWMAWGNGDCYMVKLKSNMIELDGEIRKVPMRNYSEGPWLFKREGLYYLVYASDAPGVQEEQMAYSTAESIEGPWTYRGFISTSANHGFTIHPSVIEFNGQWYYIYHDGSYSQNGGPGGDCRRSVCAEYLSFEKDGSIRFMPLTQEGLSSGIDIWNLPELQVENGPYTTEWTNLSRQYNVPAWWREAKLGAWSHWDPQSAAEAGDWYALRMYQEGRPQYKYHLEHYGHPSEFGYKDLCNEWKTDLWDPDELMQLYIKMGARYFLAMGNHHDNFDCWDSAYQPWNSVNVGPHQDIVGIWAETARKYGMPFGIGFHATPARTWGQFMTPRFTSDKNGDYAGVPYDIFMTKEDGKGKWWEGLDPKDLYGLEHHDGRNSLESPFANQFMWRVDDAIRKYQPDMIYFDEHAGDSQMDLGVNMGLGRLTPQILANFYNIAAKRSEGNKQVVTTMKGVGGRYNSFQNSPDVLPLADRSLVKSTELYTEDDIMAFPFQTEVSLQDWHYQAGGQYCSAAEIITRLMQNVSRNGCLLLNVTQRGRGDIEDEARRICLDFGRWIEINSEAVYSARPFDVWGDENVIYTRQGGNIYAVLVNWEGGSVNLSAIADNVSSVGKVTKVEMIETGKKLKFKQTAEGLEVVVGRPVLTPDITDQELASGFKVLKISYEKNWFNDDDPGVSTFGWDRKCKLKDGSFNNDLSFSDREGDTWSVDFTGKRVSIIAPTGGLNGKMKVLIDGKDCGTVQFSKGEVMCQQIVFESRRLNGKQHKIQLVNLGGSIAVDALIIK